MKRLLAWLLARMRKKEDYDREFHKDLMRLKFMGICPICSYWRFGRGHGFKVGNAPDPHDGCVEARRET